MNSSIRISAAVLALMLLMPGVVLSAEYSFVRVYENANISPSLLGSPSISGANVAFIVFSPDYGVFVGSGGSLTTIAKASDPSPIGPVDLGPTPTIPVVDGNNVGFWDINLSGGATTGFLSGSGGPLSVIVKSGDSSPVGPLSSVNMALSRSGNNYSFVSLFNGSQSLGVFSSSGGALTSIAKRGDPAPQNTFAGFSHTSIDGNLVTFIGSYPGGSGIFRGNGGSLTTIVKTGDAAPAGMFSSFNAVGSNEGMVAFRAAYSGGSGVFLSNGGVPVAIAKTGDPAPTGTFNSFENVAIAAGTVVFEGLYSGGEGLFFSDGSTISPVVKTGDALFGSTISTLEFAPSGIDPAGSGNLAFRYLLANGRSGIGLALAVPEAGSSALVGTILFSISGLRRRTRAGRR